MSFSVASASLPAGEIPVCGVTLEPFIRCRWTSNSSSQLTSLDEFPLEEASPRKTGSHCLRFRWLRSPFTDGEGQMCHIHPERPATMQCTIWIKLNYPLAYSYHCSADCFKQHWYLQKQYHEKALKATKAGGDNGFKGTAAAMKALGSDTAWTIVGKDKLYLPTEMDVGHRLKLVVQVVDTAAASEVGTPLVVTTTPVRRAPDPPLRRMIPLPLAPHMQRQQYGRFTVLTYNILADLYATREAFPTSPSWTLKWQYRRQNILKELEKYDADILCVQEMQSTHFHEDMRPELDRRGYDSVFKQKTMSEMFTCAGDYAMDGCATFFKRDRFVLVKKYEVEFNKAAQSYAESVHDQADHRRALNRLLKNNVALILVLEGLPPGDAAVEPSRRQLVCIANTHIHANPELSDVKLWQVHTLLKGLEKIANSANIPMVVAGDLNSRPGSAPHDLLVKQSVDARHPDLQNDPLSLFSGASAAKLQHSLKLKSAYAAAAATGGGGGVSDDVRLLRSRLDSERAEPLFTNLTCDFKDTLDYIIFSAGELTPTALLELPPMSAMLREGETGLPNELWSSDHVAIMAEFRALSHPAQIY